VPYDLQVEGPQVLVLTVREGEREVARMRQLCNIPDLSAVLDDLIGHKINVFTGAVGFNDPQPEVIARIRERLGEDFFILGVAGGGGLQRFARKAAERKWAYLGEEWKANWAQEVRAHAAAVQAAGVRLKQYGWLLWDEAQGEAAQKVAEAGRLAKAAAPELRLAETVTVDPRQYEGVVDVWIPHAWVDTNFCARASRTTSTSS
jgi:hypothetical protein